MDKIRVSAVSYTNSIPFVYGLHKSRILDKIELSLDIPSDCAMKLIDNQCDIGLVPLAVVAELPYYEIVSDFCIGAYGKVDSVFIFSNLPIESINTLRTDSQSRTSNKLAQLLLKKHWKVDATVVEEGEADAFVQIGDRTFGKESAYPYRYDLAEEWLKFTGLPFVFAVWAANKPISAEFKREFNEALAYGVSHRREVIDQSPPVTGIDLEDYLMHKIDYPLDVPKRTALNLFLQYIKENQI